MASTGQAIKDFYLEMGFDGKSVFDGFKTIENEFLKLQKTLSSGFKTGGLTMGSGISKVMGDPNEIKAAKERMREAKKVLDDTIASQQSQLRLDKLRNTLNRQGGESTTLRQTAEWDRYNAALRNVTNTTNKYGARSARTRQAVRELSEATNQLTWKNRQLNQSMREGNFVANGFTSSLKNLARSYVSIYAVMGGGGAAIRVGQELIGVRNMMLVTSDTAKEAGDNFEYVADMSKRLGVDIQASANGFARMGVAAKQLGFTAEDNKQIFESVLEASTAFQLTTENTQGIFKAFEQIMSKGNVQAEELRNQLGDRLPTAVALAAKSMGLTMEELDKKMKAGALKSKDFMLPFSQALREMSREGGALEEAMKKSSTAMKRFGTSVKLNILQAFDSGAESGLAEFFNQLSTFTDNAAPLFRTIGRVFGLVIRSLSTIALAIQQISRPMMIAVDYFLDGSKEGLGILNLMTKVAAGLAAIILYPFAKLEQFNNELHKASGLAIAGWGILSTIVSTIITKWLLKITGIGKLFGFVFGGVSKKMNLGLISWLTKATAGFRGFFSIMGFLIKDIFSLVGRQLWKLAKHPVILALMALTAGAMYIHETKDDPNSPYAKRLASQQSKRGTTDLPWHIKAWEMIGTGGDYVIYGGKSLVDSIVGTNFASPSNANKNNSSSIYINNVNVEKPADIVDKDTFRFYVQGGL